jgi:putative membrane protein
MMGGYGYGGHWGWGIIMMVFWVAVIVGIVFLVRWAVMSSRGPVQGTPREDEAMETLRKRFASGEIGKEEFEEKKKVLKA